MTLAMPQTANNATPTSSGTVAGCRTTRRALLAASLLGLSASVVRAQAQRPLKSGDATRSVPANNGGSGDHTPLGPVEPRIALPAMGLTLHDGSRRDLQQLLRGQATAAHLMFTGCRSACPVAGAVFASLQSRIAGQPGLQLLSLSIDPLGDDAAALKRWRTQLGARAGWVAAVPSVPDAQRVLDLFDGRASATRSAERHSSRIFLLDAQGRIAYRCAEWASAADVAKLLTEMRQIG